MGSEMCIRDSSHAISPLENSSQKHSVRPKPTAHGPRRAQPGPDGQAAAVRSRVWQAKSPQSPSKHCFKLFDKCKKSGIYKLFKPLPKVPCGTTKEIERVSEHPFGVPLLQHTLLLTYLYMSLSCPSVKRNQKPQPLAFVFSLSSSSLYLSRTHSMSSPQSPSLLHYLYQLAIIYAIPHQGLISSQFGYKSKATSFGPGN